MNPAARPAHAAPSGSPGAAALLLHGVVPIGQRLPSGPVTQPSVERDGLSALVSPLGAALVSGPDREAALAAAALAHHRLLCACRGMGDVLPMRFGAVLADRDAVAALLAREGARLRLGLEAVAGADEFGVRIVADGGPEVWTGDGAAQRPSHPGASGSASPGCGRAWLRARHAARRARGAARERRAAVIAGFVAGLAELARCAPVPSGGGPRARAAVADLAFLVPRPCACRFLDRLGAFAAAATEHGLAFEVNGPWPAYSFAAAAPARDGCAT